jgi:hypothetical protein
LSHFLAAAAAGRHAAALLERRPAGAQPEGRAGPGPPRPARPGAAEQ